MGSERQMNLYQVAQELTRRLASIFLRNSEGRRPVYGEPPSSRGPVLARFAALLRVFPRRQRLYLDLPPWGFHVFEMKAS